LHPWTQQGKKKVYPAVLKQAPKVTPKEGATSAYGCQYPLMLPMPTLTLYSLALEVQAASGCWRHPLSIFQKNARPSLSTLSRKRRYNPVRLSTQVALYVNWFQTKDCWKCHHPTKCLGHPTLKVKKKGWADSNTAPWWTGTEINSSNSSGGTYGWSIHASQDARMLAKIKSFVGRALRVTSASAPIPLVYWYWWIRTAEPT
jgi:hypothetical protein